MTDITIENPWGLEDALVPWDVDEGDSVTVEVGDGEPEFIYDLVATHGLLVNDDEFMFHLLALEPPRSIPHAIHLYLDAYRMTIANTMLAPFN